MGLNVKLSTDWRVADYDGNRYNLELRLVDLSLDYGVYVIYTISNRSYTVLYVGEGDIRKRFYAHRNDYRLLNCVQQQRSKLFVTWLNLYYPFSNLAGGIERYFANTLKPRVGERWSTDNPIIVDPPPF